METPHLDLSDALDQLAATEPDETYGYLRHRLSELSLNDALCTVASDPTSDSDDSEESDDEDAATESLADQGVLDDSTLDFLNGLSIEDDASSATSDTLEVPGTESRVNVIVASFTWSYIHADTFPSGGSFDGVAMQVQNAMLETRNR